MFRFNPFSLLYHSAHILASSRGLARIIHGSQGEIQATRFNRPPLAFQDTSPQPLLFYHLDILPLSVRWIAGILCCSFPFFLL